MNDRLSLESRTFPSRIADLGFTVRLPKDWIAHELPNEEADFSNPTQFVPLAVVTAPHAAIVFAFAARPAYENGTLHDWAWYLLQHNQLKPRAVGAGQFGSSPAIIGEAAQDSDLGPLVVRFAFLEDGRRLVNITLTAPELLADAVKDAWSAAVESFTLSSPRGPSVATQPGKEPSSSPDKPPAAESEPPGAPPKPATFAAHALADHASSLDPEQPINANLRNSGAGLVPNVVASFDAQKRATVAAGAVMAQFDVPYGWHVMDDGKRTLVFEPSGQVQINLNLLPREGRSNEAILDVLEAEARQSYPSPEFMRLKSGRIHALGIRNIREGDQALEQYHLLFPGRDQQMLVRARVTATPERSTDACNLAELILESLAFDCVQQRDEPKPVADDQPSWWRQAQALEAENRLEEAEEAIMKGVDHIGAACSVAHLYRDRMMRLQKAGDQSGAQAAYQKAVQWIYFYASQATSGGEGAALSMERDQFLQELGKASSG